MAGWQDLLQQVNGDRPVRRLWDPDAAWWRLLVLLRSSGKVVLQSEEGEVVLSVHLSSQDMVRGWGEDDQVRAAKRSC